MPMKTFRISIYLLFPPTIIFSIDAKTKRVHLTSSVIENHWMSEARKYCWFKIANIDLAWFKFRNWTTFCLIDWLVVKCKNVYVSKNRMVHTNKYCIENFNQNQSLLDLQKFNQPEGGNPTVFHCATKIILNILPWKCILDHYSTLETLNQK